LVASNPFSFLFQMHPMLIALANFLIKSNSELLLSGIFHIAIVNLTYYQFPFNGNGGFQVPLLFKNFNSGFLLRRLIYQLVFSSNLFQRSPQGARPFKDKSTFRGDPLAQQVRSTILFYTYGSQWMGSFTVWKQLRFATSRAMLHGYNNVFQLEQQGSIAPSHSFHPFFQDFPIGNVTNFSETLHSTQNGQMNMPTFRSIRKDSAELKSAEGLLASCNRRFPALIKAGSTGFFTWKRSNSQTVHFRL